MNNDVSFAEALDRCVKEGFTVRFCSWADVMGGGAILMSCRRGDLVASQIVKAWDVEAFKNIEDMYKFYLCDMCKKIESTERRQNELK